MSKILDLFPQKEILNYTRNREPQEMLGETLFPSRKVRSLKLDQLMGGNSLPVAAQVHGFDTEAEIGSREAAKQAIELALIKRKMQLGEEEIISLQNPRNAEEQTYLMQNVYNDIDFLVNGVRARIERMRMQLLATGVVSLKDGDKNARIDYFVPAEHKATTDWSSADANPIQDIMDWSDKMDTAPTRALTSKKVLTTIMRNKNTIASVFGSDTGKILTKNDLDAFMEANGLPKIRTYDKKYRTQEGKTYSKHRYFDEEAFVMFDDQLLGETLYGPTAEEIRLTSDPQFNTGLVGNIFTTIYEESGDPVSTWEKAVATAIPSFAAVDDVFQATVFSKAEEKPTTPAKKTVKGDK